MKAHTHLKVQNYCPNESQCQLWVSIGDVIGSDVHQLHVLSLEKGQSSVHILQHVKTHLAFLARLWVVGKFSVWISRWLMDMLMMLLTSFSSDNISSSVNKLWPSRKSWKRSVTFPPAFLRWLLIHFVNVFFCIASRSSGEEKSFGHKRLSNVYFKTCYDNSLKTWNHRMVESWVLANKNWDNKMRRQCKNFMVRGDLERVLDNTVADD